MKVAPSFFRVAIFDCVCQVELEKPTLAGIIAQFDEFAKALNDAANKKGKKSKKKKGGGD